jgi:sulfoquinovosidase
MNIPNLQLQASSDGFSLYFEHRLILCHSKTAPCLWIGAGVADIEMFRGNFSIKISSMKRSRSLMLQ